MTDHASGTGAPVTDAADEVAPDQVAPSKPAAPRVPRRAHRAPEPVDIDVSGADIVSPVAAPAPDEVAPSPRGPFDMLPEEAPATTASLSTVEALGRAAAANASLSASGAPTPLGGIPRVDAIDLGDLDLDDSGPRFVPTFAGAAAVARTPEPAEPDPAPASPLPRHDLESGAPLYRPRVGPDQADAPAPPPPPEPETGTPAEEDPREPGRAWPLVLVGLVAIAGITLAIVWPHLSPDPIEIPAQRVMSAPETPALDPITLEDPSPFLAAMPATAGLWVVTGASTQDPAADTVLPGRVVEHHTLTYGDGDQEVTVEARQLYSEDDAARALSARAGEDAEPVDAVVAGEVVGARVERSNDTDTRVMWTHGSAYFEAVGPTDAVLAFVEVFGL